MEKVLKLLKLFQSDKYKFESGASLWLPEIDKKMKEAIAGLEKIQLTRREWYQKGYNDAMKKITEGGTNDT